MARARRALESLPAEFLASCREPEITVVVLSHGRVERTLAAIESLSEQVRIPLRTLVIDNRSDDQTRAILRERTAGNASCQLILLDKNLGCAGGRMFALQHVSTEYLLLIDNDVVVLPGAIESLFYALKSRPDAQGATGKVIFPDGSIHVCGAGFRAEADILWFELMGAGRYFDEDIGVSGECDWIPGCLALLRKSALEQHPYDLAFNNYYKDLEWCYRLRQAGYGAFVRSVDALAVHYHESKVPVAADTSDYRRTALHYLRPIARFHRLYDKILPTLFDFVPALGSVSDRQNLDSGRLLLTLIDACGEDCSLNAWERGMLSPLFELKAARDDVHRLLERQTTSDATIAGLVNQVKERQTAVDILAAELAARQQRVVELTALVAERQGEVERLSTGQAANHAKIAALVDQVKERQSAVDALAADVAVQLRRATELTASVAERQAAADSLAEQVRAGQERVLDLTALVAERQQEVERLAAELSERDAKVALLVNQVQERQSAVDCLAADLATQLQRITELTALVAERQQEVERLGAEKAENDLKIAGLTDHVKELRSEVERQIKARLLAREGAG